MSESILDLSRADAAGCRGAHQPDARTTHPLVEKAWRDRMIREAAYFRSQHRSPGPGKELDDWLHAEAEVDRFLTEK